MGPKPALLSTETIPVTIDSLQMHSHGGRMAIKLRTLVSALSVGVGFWIADALFGTFLAQSDTFWNLLLFRIPSANLASRLLVIVISAGLAVLHHQSWSRRAQLMVEANQRLLNESLSEATLALRSRTGIEEICQEILSQAARLVPHDAANIMVLNDDTLQIAGWRGYEAFGNEPSIQPLRQPLERFPLIARSMNRREALYVADTHASAEWVWRAEFEWIRSHLAVPIFHGENMLGVLRVDSQKTDAFTPEDARRLELLAGAVAFALENVQFYDLMQQEITERHEAEAQSHEHELRLRHMTEQLPISVWGLDRELRITHQLGSVTHVGDMVNAHEELVGTPVYDFLCETVSAELARERMAAFERTLAGETIRHSYRLNDRYVEDIMSPVRNDQGEIIGIVGVASDVTERVETEMALRNAERRLHHITTQLPMALWSTDTDLRVTYYSSTLQGDEGYEERKATFLGKTLPDIHREALPEDDVQRRMAHYQRALAGETVQYENVFFNGWIQGTLSPLRDDSGRIIGLVGLVLDITERKKLEEELLRTEKLESLSVLAGGIAHDFNNFLCAILSHLSIASRTLRIDSQARDVLAKAEKASRRAQALTQQLMTFAKGGVPLRRTISIPQVVQDAASFSLTGSRVEGRIDIPDDLWAVHCDEGLISQAISNIVLNAVQATPGSGYISVRARNVHLGQDSPYPLPAGDFIEIAVADQGVGIPDQNLPRLFDPFFTTKQGGTGLGLPSAHSIIRKHEGHISVETRHGQGTTFRVLLPASSEPVLPLPQPDTEPLPGSGRILVMDDDRMLCVAIEMMLESLGYEAEFAADGQEAIDLYVAAMSSGRPFDAVLMDLTVNGGMGGHEAGREIAKVDSQARLIISSGYSDDPIMANYRDYGFSAVIPKPFEITGLSRVLHQVIHVQDSQADHAPPDGDPSLP